MARAEVKDSRILLHTQPHERLLAKSIPGYRWHPGPLFWSYPATPAAARNIAEAFQGAVIGDELYEALLEKEREAYRARLSRDATDLPDFPGATVSWSWQRQAFHFSVKQDAVLLAMDMGTGKSKVAIGLAEAWNARRVLITAPVSALPVWPAQFNGPLVMLDGTMIEHGHATPEYGWCVYSPEERSIERRAELFREAIAKAAERDVPLVICVNHEAAAREPLKSMLLEVDWDLTILDESHRYKAPGGVWSQWAARLGRKARRRLGLTGTPLAHSPLDAYAQCRYLDPGLFGTSFTRFRSRYAIMGGFQNRQVVGYQNERELSERLGRIMFVVYSDEVQDLPERQHIYREVQLSEAASKTYVELDKELIADVGTGVVTVSNALSRLLRLQQITSGHLPVEDHRGVTQITELDHSKRDTLLDTVRDIGDEPVVVFARFTHDLAQVRWVAEKLGRRYGECSGPDKSGMDGPRMRDDVDLLGVQIQAGALGIDLTRARYAIFMSLGYNLEEYEQAMKRVHRPGQTRKTFYIHLLARLHNGNQTNDFDVYSALRQRKNVVKAVIEKARGRSEEVG